MHKTKDKRPVDKDNKPHGKWETFYSSGQPWKIQGYQQGVPCGYGEVRFITGRVIKQTYTLI